MKIAIWPEGSWIDMDDESVEARIRDGWSDDFRVVEVKDDEEAEFEAEATYRMAGFLGDL
jgi:hypothetical protein